MGRKVSRKSAINYYKNSSAYRKMCKDLMMKYKRYGRLTGRISLKDYTDKQKVKIADFVGESVADLGSKNDVSVAKIKSAHLDTKYGDYDLAYLASEVTGIGLTQMVANRPKRLSRKPSEMRLGSYFRLLDLMS